MVAHASAQPPPRSGFYRAFSASAREQVDAVHAAWVAAGVAARGSDEGPPGRRVNYNPWYYAAFLLNPVGHRVEAVVHERIGVKEEGEPGFVAS